MGDRRPVAYRQIQTRSETRTMRIMRTGQGRAEVPQVALLLETSTEYGRGLLRGILRFSRLHGPWSLCVAPGHFDQALPKARSWKGNGIIARISSRGMEARIGATGLPFVASSPFESSALLQAGRYGEIRTNSVEIGYGCASSSRCGPAELRLLWFRRLQLVRCARNVVLRNIESQVPHLFDPSHHFS